MEWHSRMLNAFHRCKFEQPPENVGFALLCFYPVKHLMNFKFATSLTDSSDKTTSSHCRFIASSQKSHRPVLQT